MVDLKALEVQYEGARYGDLVLKHCRKESRIELERAMKGLCSGLPLEVHDAMASLVDHAGQMGRHADWWGQSLARALRYFTAQANLAFSDAGVKANDDLLFLAFNIIVINDAMTCKNDRNSKKFVQVALGMGFIRRIFS